MNRRNFLLLGTTTIAVTSGYVLTRSGSTNLAPPIIPSEERASTSFHMRPPKRERPVIAVLADNLGSETTDLIIPWSVLTRSGIADVYVVATNLAPIQLMPAMKIQPQLSIEQFSKRFPEGADYVIVPAFHDPNSQAAIRWIQEQHRTGATAVGICAGALPLAHAGLLEGKRATTHWHSQKDLKRVSPTLISAPDRRYVADDRLITTTGVSASLPLALSLVEAIAGKETSDALAATLGAGAYDQNHASGNFKMSGGSVARGSINAVAFLGHEKLGLKIKEGVDELALAFTADAWSRTYKSRCYTVSNSQKIISLNGLEIIPDKTEAEASKLKILPELNSMPGQTLDIVLRQIAQRYGRSTASLVALQLEYPWTS
ncbi:MAG: transcriptional regulator [Robiginitomaculum sp.]|nr:MAG: transcriptional regulator [Robiginitomaculum sp.]